MQNLVCVRLEDVQLAVWYSQVVKDGGLMRILERIQRARHRIYLVSASGDDEMLRCGVECHGQDFMVVGQDLVAWLLGRASVPAGGSQ